MESTMKIDMIYTFEDLKWHGKNKLGIII